MTNTPLAIRTNAELDESILLGHILFMTIEELKIHKDDLASLFAKHSLSKTFLPHEIKPHDAYRRATKRAEGSIEVNVPSGKQRARLLVREVRKDNDNVHRHLVRELIDEKNITTDYATVGKLIFDRKTELMNISWDAAYLGEFDYKKVLEDTVDLYTEWTQFHTKDTVRNIVNKVVKSTHPISIMQGGRAQFVPKHNRDVLFNLKNMVAELPGHSLAEVIPMIDTVDQRDLLTKNLEREVLADVDALLNDFANLLQGTTSLRSSQVKRYAESFAALQEKTGKYEQLLSSKMVVLQQQLLSAIAKVQSAAPEEDAEEEEEEQPL